MISGMFQYALGRPAEYADPAWAELAGTVLDLFVRFPGVENREAFEKDAIGALGELLDAGWAAYGRADAEHRWFGCFRGTYDPALQRLTLHVRNAVRPQSPFNDMAARRAELRALCGEFARIAEPPREIRCASWLNALPAFRALFPPAFARSLEPEGPFPTGLGWWGQLIGRDGRLNRRRAEALRQNGRFEFPRLSGVCPFRMFEENCASPNNR
jgi:hypothetical protein